MKVGLYYPWIYLTSGAERTILELSGRSRHQWTLFTSHYDPAHTFAGFAERRVVEVGGVSVARSVASVAGAAWQVLKLRLRAERYDALVIVCEGLGDLAVFRNADCPVICICLTPLRLAFDSVYRAHVLRRRSRFERLLIRAGSAAFRHLDRRAWKRYSKVFFISEEARRRAVEGGLIRPGEGELLHVGLGFYPPRPSSRFDRYFLLPGRIMWTKNIELGIAAFRLFRASRPEFADFRLVVAGIVDRKSEPYLDRLRQLAAAEPGIEFRIFPSDSELAELYRDSYAVLFTAFNEDWGIVPLEGMAFGKPVVAVNRGGPRESIGHGVHGFLEEPEPRAFAARMIQLAGDAELAREMGRAAHRHARQFDWDRFTARIDETVEQLGSRAGLPVLVASGEPGAARSSI